MRQTIWMLGMGLLALCGSSMGANAQEAESLPLRPFKWSVDLSKASAVDFWISKGPYTVNYAGPTKEQARPGHKTYKLDVSMPAHTTYAYWIVKPTKRIPSSQGHLQADISFQIAASTTAQVNFGGMFSIHSASKKLHSGNINTWYIDQDKKGQWQTWEQDVILAGRYTAKRVMRRFHQYIKRDDVATYLEGVLIKITSGKKASRAVIYIDEITLTGDIPSQANYQKFVKKRWNIVHQLMEKKWSNWGAKVKKAIQSVKLLRQRTKKPAVQIYADNLIKRLQSLDKLIRTSRQSGTINRDDYAQIESSLGAADEMAAALPQASDWFASHSDYRRYVVRPISEYRYIPSDIYPLAPLGGEVHLVGTRGQVVPASVVFATDIPRGDVTLKVSALAGKEGQQIDASQLSVRVVKSWYQTGTAWTDIRQKKGRVLVPELLLYDEALVKVDEKAQTNSLRLDRGNKQVYEPVLSAKPSKSSAMWNPTPSEYPVRDADALVPRPMAAKTSRQFWISASIPLDATAGSYLGDIQILSDGQVIDTLAVTLEVLPFDLAASPLEHSIYYRGRLSPKYPDGTVSSDYKSEDQLLNDFKNMLAHGVTNPTIYQYKKQRVSRYLDLRTQAGLSNEVLYVLTSASTPKNQLKSYLSFLRDKGVKTVYFYGKDEAAGPRLVAQRAAWDSVHQLGGKVFAAGTHENLRVMGDLQDLQVNAGVLSRELAAGWHARGSRIFSYANPQVGAENPMVYRKNYGLRLWHSGYDGAMNYAYQHAMGNIWDDADHSVYRDHVFAYPTANGLIDTIAWEGYREGVTDVRYLATLQQTIEKASASHSPQAQTTAQKALAWIASLDDAMLIVKDPQPLRQQMIQFILQMQEAMNKTK